MTTEKRVLLAALICSVFLAWYMQFMRLPSQPHPPIVRQTPSTSAETSAKTSTDISSYLVHQEKVTIIESPDLLLEIGDSSGAIRRATLKKFLDTTRQKPMSFDGKLPVFAIHDADHPIQWTRRSSNARTVTLGATNRGDEIEISYTLRDDVPLVDILVTQQGVESSDGEIIVMNAWSHGDAFHDGRNPLEAMVKSMAGGKTRYDRYTEPTKEPRHVPRGTSVLSLSERYFCLSVKPELGAMRTSLIPFEEGVIVAESLVARKTTQHVAEYKAKVYIGPRDYFYMDKAGFGDAFPIGIMGQIGLLLLMSLSWIAKVTRNYGVAIIIFSGLITCLMAPFTIMGFRSMKKLQELKPKIDRIMQQYKGDQAKANQAIFALYREHRVNPLSGCLPLLLQMPIFIAMFQAISHFIELRGKSFLWVSDLSMPDRLAKLPISVPFIGDYLNLLPLVMAAAMYFQTKMSQTASAATESNPTMKMMSGPIMPVMFGVMFYQFPSGLVLYWLTNSVISLILYKATNTQAV